MYNVHIKITKSHFSLKMPKKETHGSWRSHVCLICFQKTDSFKIVYVIDKNNQEVVGAVLKRVREHFFTNFDPKDTKLPNGLCGKLKMTWYSDPNLQCPFQMQTRQF